MGYKFGKIPENGGEEIFETIVFDGTRRRIDRHKVLKKDYPEAVRRIVDKFGIPGIRVEIRKKDDIDWMRW